MTITEYEGPPQFFGPSYIASMQRLFRNYWRVECRPNPRNKNMVTWYLVRGPACPFYQPPAKPL